MHSRESGDRVRGLHVSWGGAGTAGGRAAGAWRIPWGRGGYGAPRARPARAPAPPRCDHYAWRMCRNIRTLYNYDPPATEEEVRAAALQYVRKISGFSKPSHANEEAFERAVDAVAAISMELLNELRTTAAPRNREVEAAKARARAQQRFATA